MAKHNWDFITDSSDVNDDCEKLMYKLMESVDQAKRIKISNNSYKTPWMTSAILQSCLHKHNLFKQFQSGLIAKTEYTMYRNRLTNLIRERKKQYYIEICKKNKKNSKIIWEHLNDLLGRQTLSNTPTQLDCNIVNNFFANLGPSTVANLPPPKFHYNKYVRYNEHSFFVTDVSMQDLQNVVNSLPSKNSAGFDGLSVKFLKIVFPFIAKSLLILINKSFTSGSFPNLLKIARVVPIFKGGSPDDLINYRPISVLPSLSKIFERLLYDKLLSFINKFNLISNCQFGFQKNLNTELAVIHALHHITNSLNANVPVLGLFIDISKAFDSINHSILLDKLFRLGFRGTIHSLLSSYLSNRFLFVEINGAKSNFHKISCGVPQGSILGPLIFLLYINDISYVSEHLHFTLFADDTTILLSDPNLKYSLSVAETYFVVVFDWFISNRLLINFKKTNFIIFGHSHLTPDCTLSISNNVILRTNVCKFLGIFIDENLNWSNHMDHTCSKLSKAIGMIKVAQMYMPRAVLMSMFQAFVVSYLRYGVLLWGNTFPTYIYRVRVLFNKAIRAILSVPPTTHMSPLLHKLQVLTVDDVYIFNCCIFMYKIKNCMLPTGFCNMFIKLSDMYVQTRRSKHDYYLKSVHLDVCKRFIFFAGVKNWSSLSNDIKCAPSLSVFKNVMFCNLIFKYE